MSSRWDRLLDLKTLTLVDALMAEAAKAIAEGLLASWPLPVEGLDVETGGEFAPLLAEDSQRPPLPVFVEATRLARWDLLREFEALDEYMRNRRFEEHGITEEHRVALLFVSRWIVEQLLSLGEVTDGRVRRKDMAACLDRLDRLLLPS